MLKPALLLAAAALAMLNALPASAGGVDARVSPEGWASRILAEATGREDPVTRESYRKRAEGYVRFQSSFAQDVYGPKMASGSSARQAEAARMIERMIERAQDYVRNTEDALFAVIDPDGDGIAARSEARQALAAVARFADLDDNGLLDRTEQRLAEAALASGVDLSDPVARRSLVWRLERSGGFLD